jgi:hypothetical protein
LTRGWIGNAETVEEPEREEGEEPEASVLPGDDVISLITPDSAPPVAADDEPEEDQLH